MSWHWTVISQLGNFSPVSYPWAKMWSYTSSTSILTPERFFSKFDPFAAGKYLQKMQKKREIYTVKPVFKTTWDKGTTWDLRTATSVPMPIQYIEMELANKTTSEFRTFFHSPLGVPNSQVSLYIRKKDNQ